MLGSWLVLRESAPSDWLDGSSLPRRLAFNTIDHDKLLQVVYDLGFPVDRTEVTKDLYTDESTEIMLPAGNTPAVRIERGTKWGDSL